MDKETEILYDTLSVILPISQMGVVMHGVLPQQAVSFLLQEDGYPNKLYVRSLVVRVIHNRLTVFEPGADVNCGMATIESAPGRFKYCYQRTSGGPYQGTITELRLLMSDGEWSQELSFEDPFL